MGVVFRIGVVLRTEVVCGVEVSCQHTTNRQSASRSDRRHRWVRLSSSDVCVMLSTSLAAVPGRRGPRDARSHRRPSCADWFLWSPFRSIFELFEDLGPSLAQSLTRSTRLDIVVVVVGRGLSACVRCQHLVRSPLYAHCGDDRWTVWF